MLLFELYNSAQEVSQRLTDRTRELESKTSLFDELTMIKKQHEDELGRIKKQQEEVSYAAHVREMAVEEGKRLAHEKELALEEAARAALEKTHAEKKKCEAKEKELPRDRKEALVINLP